MDEDHLQHCLQYEFDKGSSIKLALRNIQQTYGNGSLNESMCRQFYKKFRSQKFNNEDDEEENNAAPSADDDSGAERNGVDKPGKSKGLPPPKKMARRCGTAPSKAAVPPTIEHGFQFTDGQKNEFKLGKEIGMGGFGRIYQATQFDRSGIKSEVAVKVESNASGPLFTEMHVYERFLKKEHLAQFKRDNDIQFLGLPIHISSGLMSYKSDKMRFLVMPKYADSVSAALARSETCFSLAQVLQITSCVLHAYDYLHHVNYVHADVKASNLLMEKKNEFKHVVLIDFGLARKLPEDLVEKVDKKTAHNGTIEFTSCDAHRGCLPSYRGDLEILTHNMLYWLTSSLPWENEKNPDAVYAGKLSLIKNVQKELPPLIESKKALSIVRYFYKMVEKMNYTDRINFASLQGVLKKAT